MKRCYKNEHGELWNGDAVEFLQTFPTGSVRLVIADPPYGIGKAEWDSLKKQRDYVAWSLIWIREAARILDDRGSLYVMGFSEILADLKWATSDLFPGCKWLVWYYRNKANMGNGWGRSHESILHFRKSRQFGFNTDSVRVPYNSHTARYPKHPQAKTSQYGNGKEHTWKPHPLGAKPRDVIEIPTLCNGTAEKTSHPTQKPLALIRQFVLASSNPGDLVVDSFGGSGTTYIACEESGRRWAGCESDLNYCNLIMERIKNPERFRGDQTDLRSSEIVKRRREALRYGRTAGR